MELEVKKKKIKTLKYKTKTHSGKCPSISLQVFLKVKISTSKTMHAHVIHSCIHQNFESGKMHFNAFNSHLEIVSRPFLVRSSNDQLIMSTLVLKLNFITQHFCSVLNGLAISLGLCKYT